MRMIFWFSLFWVIYAYGGYLAVLTVMTMFKKKEPVRDDDFTPQVSLVIAAHNEERVIKRKIEESLDLDYPKDKLEIIIASDASTDRTDDIVKGFRDRGVVLARQDVRAGKTAAQNLAVERSKGEILVFSDATTEYGRDALRKLARNFSDERVGCVGGQERFIESDTEISKEAGFFWRYENMIREKESRFNTMIGVSGCVFAIRKALYEPLDEKLIEDFALPLITASKGYRVVYEGEAIACEHAAPNRKTELDRKTRIVSGGITVVGELKYLLNPLRYPSLAFQLVSHKIFRWLAPLFMALLFVASLALVNTNIWFYLFGTAEIAFYLVGIAGYILRDNKDSPRICRLIYHFCAINMAAVLGVIRFVRGERKVIWEPVR